MKHARAITIGSLIVLSSVAVPMIWGEQLGQQLNANPWFGSRFTWGSEGQDGRSGRDGRSGESANDQIIYADGNPLNLDLSGGDGSDGDDGEHGESARCPIYWGKPEHNLNGADGGNGGSGGDAGVGGNGGDLTIFYQQPQELRNIFVNNFGGEAGFAGRGGRGGDGCDCYDNSWRVKVCEKDDDDDKDCKTKTYYCRDGRDGRDGKDGTRGRDGQSGNVTLVQNLTSIPLDRPTARATVSELQNRSLTLSKNIWRSQSGLLSKLASGSKVNNQYREYVELWEVPVSLTWQANQASQPFDNAEFQLALSDRRNLEVNQSGSLWLDYFVANQGEGYEITVTRAIAREGATGLIRKGVNRQDGNLTFSAIDLGDYADWIDTEFQVIYRTRDPKPRFRQGYTYQTRFNQTLDFQYVQENNGEFTLDLSNLPIESKYLRSGTTIELEIIAKRSFAKHSATQTMRWSGQLP